MALKKIKDQILRDLPEIGILRPELERFNKMFDFWFLAPIEKKLSKNMDTLDILLRAYAVGYFYGQSAAQQKNTQGENKMLRKIDFSNMWPVLSDVRKEMNQLMNSMSDDFEMLFGNSSHLDRWKQTENGYELRLEIPGFSKDEVKMEIDQETETLMIEGKKKDQNDRFASQSTFRISRTLPEKTKLSSVSASVQDGVWLISVQSEKKETKSRTISVPIS